MEHIDDQTKTYVKRPEVFADLFNYLIYGGRCVIHPDDLSELDTTEIFLPFDKKGKVYPVQKYRDVLKHAVVMEDQRAAYTLILGIENQTDSHYAMPVRNMGYDAYNYAAQVTAIARRNRAEKKSDPDIDFLSGLKKDDKILPVITLVVHFGQDPWDGPVRVHEMFAVEDPEILKYVPDYRINLISPISMTEEEIDKFTTDFKELAAFIRCSKDKDALRDLVENNEKFRHMDLLTANVANRVTNSRMKLKIDRKGEVDMCVAIAGIRAEGRMEGKKEGKIEGENRLAALMQKLFKAGRSDELERVSEDAAYREKLMEEFGLE